MSREKSGRGGRVRIVRMLHERSGAHCIVETAPRWSYAGLLHMRLANLHATGNAIILMGDECGCAPVMMLVLLRLHPRAGDSEKVIQLATMCRTPEIYVIAANYLQVGLAGERRG